MGQLLLKFEFDNGGACPAARAKAMEKVVEHDLCFDARVYNSLAHLPCNFQESNTASTSIRFGEDCKEGPLDACLLYTSDAADE